MTAAYQPPYPPASRREMLGLVAGLAAVAPLPAVVFEWPRLSALWHAGDARRRVLERISDLLIPATDTAGAAQTGVARFVELALRHGLDGTRDPAAGGAIVGALDDEERDMEPEAARRLLRPVKAALDTATGGDFLKAAADAQATALAALDAHAFAPGQEDHPWHKLKDLILLGYYTSEVGGSKELRYELVPGRFDPDVPLTPDTRAFSSDWTAVEFG